MSIYENNGKRIRVSVNLTKSQKSKLKSFTDLFGTSEQRFFADCVDFMFADTYKMQIGQENAFNVCKNTAQKVLDSYVELDKIKGLEPVPYTRDHEPKPFSR